jgi:formylglycine-generating enzyme
MFHHRSFFKSVSSNACKHPWRSAILRSGLWVVVFLGVFSPLGQAESIPPKSASTTMSRIPNGSFIPPFLKDSTLAQVPVDAFLLDTYPVTQKQFAEFVRRNPKWKRTGKTSLFNDANYLHNWLNDSTPKPENAKSPVTFVTWHAAKAYCAETNRRLPTTIEWERVAGTRLPQQDSIAMVQEILSWYGKPSGLGVGSIGTGTHHEFGVNDLHALVWEWTSDFRSWGYAKFGSMNSEDSAQFCGGGGNRKNSNDYIIFMRYGLRSSLEPHFAVAALGFRCAADISPR